MARSRKVSLRAGHRPIAYSELVRKAKAGKLSDAEIERYFEVDQEARKRFRFRVKLRAGAVTFDGKRPSADEVNNLLLEVDIKRRQARAKAAKIAGKRARLPKALELRMKAAVASAKVKTKVLAEGDSWFCLPPVIKPDDAMDFFNETHDLVNVAKWGHTLQQMVAAKQYVQKLRAGTFGFFFFSGGGNDVLASIGSFVKQRRPGDTDPNNASNYIDAKFEDTLTLAIRNYRKMLKDVAAIPAAANVVIFLHGYANAIPVKNGKSIGKFLQQKGFDPVAHEALCRAIVARMVGMFNDRLESLAASARNVVYVDLRPIVGQHDWYKDEIHPNDGGARKIANEFARRLAENTPAV